MVGDVNLFGKGNKTAKVLDKLVPIMAGAYAIVLLLFAFSTFLGILFYAKSNVSFIVEGKLDQNIYKTFALSMMFVGGLSQYLFVWALADMGVGLMTVLNLFAIVPLDSLPDYEENYMPSKKRSTKIEKI